MGKMRTVVLDDLSYLYDVITNIFVYFLEIYKSLFLSFTVDIF